MKSVRKQAGKSNHTQRELAVVSAASTCEPLKAAVVSSQAKTMGYAIFVTMIAASPLWSILPYKNYLHICEQNICKSLPSNRSYLFCPQNLSKCYDPNLRHVNSKWMNAAMWHVELDNTGHRMACPYIWGLSFLGRLGISKLGCVRKFEGLEEGKKYVTLTKADLAIFSFGKINDGLLGPMSGLLRPIAGPLGRFADVADRAVTESAAAAKTATMVADRAVTAVERCFWGYLLFRVAQILFYRYAR
jgi:hypothetical protein